MVRDCLAVTALAMAAMLPYSGEAGAVTLAQLNAKAPQLRLCPKPSCPAVAAGAVGSGGMVPVFEFSGTFARVGPYMTREAAAAHFPGADASSLPENPALWIARAMISTGDAAADLAAAQTPEESEKLPAAKQRLTRPPVPEPSPRQRTLAAQPAAKPAAQAATRPQGPAPDAEPLLPQMPAASTQLVASAPPLSPLPVKAVPAAAEPAPQALATPGKPETLTPELMDKRLKVLPSKPNADYTMAQVVALRRQGLAYLDDGSCTGIKEGGKTLTSGFLYLVCDGDEAWRQFAQ